MSGSPARRLRKRLAGKEPPALDEYLADLADAAGDPGLAEAGRVLAEFDRRVALVHAEAAWFRRMGWRVMRPMLAVGILAAAFFAFGQRSIDPATGFGVFLLGAGAFYVVLQVYLHRWARQDARALARARAELADRLREAAGSRGEDGEEGPGAP